MANYDERLTDIQKQINELQSKADAIKKERAEEEKRKNNEFLSYLREHKDVIFGLFPNHDFENLGVCEGWYYGTDGRIIIDSTFEALNQILHNEWEDRFEVSFDVYVRPIDS